MVNRASRTARIRRFAGTTHDLGETGNIRETVDPGKTSNIGNTVDVR